VLDLSNFFLGVKKLAENPNPSGSGIVTHIGGEFFLLGSQPHVGSRSCWAPAPFRSCCIPT